MTSKIRRRTFVFLGLILTLFGFMQINATPVFSESGAWIGDNEIDDSGPGGSGTGGVATRSYSWIKYESRVDHPQEIYFTPYTLTTDATSIAKKVKIAASCSDGEDKYFWHIGTNAQSADMDGRAAYTHIYAFGNYAPPLTLTDTGFPETSTTGIKWSSGSQYTSTEEGYIGHSDTRQYSTFRKWDVNNNPNGWYEQTIPSNVNHELYYGGNLIYEATESASSEVVFRDFQKAFNAANESKHITFDPSNEDHMQQWYGTYAFCYWKDDAKERTLNIIGKNIYDDSNLPKSLNANQKKTGTKDSRVSVTRTNLSTSGYKFIGWKKTESTETGGIITTTDSSNNPYLSSASATSAKFYKSGTEYAVHKKLIYRFGDSDDTLYAYYAKKYSLTKESENAIISVDRKYAKYAGTKDNLSESDAIYQDDRLKICFKAKDGYALTSVSIKNNKQSVDISIADAENNKAYCTDTRSKELLVEGDVVISATAEQRTLTGYAVTENGANLNSGNAVCSATVAYGAKATCTNNKSINGYTLQGYRTKKDSGPVASGNTYTVNSLKSDTTVYFVYKINRHTLTMPSYSTNNASLSSFSDLGTKTTTVNYNQTAPLSHGNNSYFVFQGYKASGKCAGDGKGVDYLTNTSSTSLNCSDGTRGYYLSGKHTNKYDYDTYNYVKLQNDATVYAYYSPKAYALTAIADAHSTITVKRTSSPYASASTGQILSKKNGTATTTIYYGDILEVTYSSDNCFSLTTQKIETTSKKPEDHVVDPVSSDVTVSSESATTQYKLTVNRAAGSGIKVNRTSSPNKGASRGDLYNKIDASDDLNKKFDIYCGDTLKTNFSLFEGYSWGSHSLVGKDTNNTTDLSPPEHTVGADVIVQTTDMVRNAFLGRARVTTGDTFNNVDSGKISTTDWSNIKKTITRKINCPNAGCSAVFDLALKREEGSGKTPYVAKRNNEDLTLKIDSTQRAPYMPSTNGSTLIIDKKTEYQESLKPGQEVCYSIEFKPYGKLSNDKTVPLKACAQGKVATFEGMSEAGASEADSKSTGWQNKTPDKETRYILENCDPIAGCKATIKHSLKKTEGSGSTDYTITRRSNYYDAKTGHGYKSRDSEDPLASGTFSPNNNNSQTIRSEELTLYPGQVVCETLSFLPSNNQVNAPNLAKITVCVSAIGNAQSPDPTPGTPDDGTPPGTPDPNDPQEESTISNALINIKVKNTNVTKYRTYQYTVYAKPNDILLYRSSYNPKLQYTTKLIPEKMRIDGGATIYSNSGLSLQYLFNEKTRNVINPWNNDITVNIGNESKDYDYTVGDTSRQVEVSDERKVNTADVGKKIDGIARTNQKASTKTTPSQVTFTDDGTGNVANVITSPISSTATAIVPYNFKSKVEITTDEDTPIHSGEEDTLLFDVDVLPKPNSETTNNPDKEAYATIVRNPKTKLIQYTIDGEPKDEGTYGSDDLCGYFSGNSGCQIAYEKTLEDLNKNSNKAGSKHSFTAKLSVPDVKAGTKICFAAAFYPSDSGSDTNLSASGSGLWAVSKSKCYTVAKKPSFQAWGGSMYIAGEASVPVSAKKNLSGYTSDGNYHVFGSWVEIGLTVGSSGSNSLILSGVSGLASGAGTGYSGLSFARNPGGSSESSLNFCKRSTLSIANDACDSGKIHSISSSGSNATANDKETLINKVLAGKKLSPKAVSIDTELNLLSSDNNTEGMSDSKFFYYKGDSSFYLSGVEALEPGTTYLVQSSDTITIKGDLSYGSATYSKLSEVPKLIIYAKKIKINCDVSRIDAVLIADDNIDTCPTENKSDINRPENSNRLQVNGMIISNTLNLNRTYGAATGDYSIIPAEIVNLDTTLYLWSSGDDNAGGGTGKFSESYIHELAPRY